MLTKIFDFILEVLELLKQALLIFIHRNRAVSIIFFADGRRLEMAELLVLRDTEKVSLSVQFVDIKGNPAPVDGVPTWASSNEAILTATASADGMSAEVVAVGPLGPAQVSVTGDADLGAGVAQVIGTQDINVVPSEAVSAVITAGAPEPQ